MLNSAEFRTSSYRFAEDSGTALAVRIAQGELRQQHQIDRIFQRADVLEDNNRGYG